MSDPRKKNGFARALLGTATAVTAAAVTGGMAGDADSTWYRRLRKPRWQPPGWAFGVVWPVLYATIAYAGARALAASDDRPGVTRALAVNLALNTAWTPLFFRAHAPRLAMADLLALNASNAVLVSRCLRADRGAGLTLLPYAGWTLFATALNGWIAARNPGD
ncbi:TspO/MBR family protein [Nonomuraea cavernae]|uniref:Sensory protein TspO n=1 Tax=Nonomuraea cavernae TaxID=2045107 RepID=A0A918DPL6_9ACTN|nr:TspO/MBR family protein [Nonomuraea cavernae]MCA2188870.1 tryptophan-rich sensory protein [Nonomuraea cavernae]GGO78490.1 sensory protein TspO [Nonomuraea cavernae]